MSAPTKETLYSAGSFAGLTPAASNNTSAASTAANTTFRIVFWGQCARGYQRADVMQAFGKRFKIEQNRHLEPLFSGKVRTLKKGLTESQANKYVNAMLEVGGICRKESEQRDYFSETEFKQRNSVSFLEDDFDASKLSLSPKDEFSSN